MEKNYECCICHEPIERKNRLVYQEYDNKKPYGVFHNRCNYDFCDKCFRFFKAWILKHKRKDDLEIGVEVNLNKE